MQIKLNTLQNTLGYVAVALAAYYFYYLSSFTAQNPNYGRFVRLPTIDISSFYSNSTNASIRSQQTFAANAIADASKKFGSFYISNFDSNFDANDYSQLFESAQHLFAIDESQKQKLSVKSGGFSRGYLPYGSETGNKVYFEKKEGFSYGYNKWNDTHKPRNNMEGSNVWPETSLYPASLRLRLTSFYDTLIDVSFILTRAYSIAMGYASQNQLLSMSIGGETISIMRLFRYFAKDSATDDNIIGSSPHTDWGFLTLILADAIPGLQIYFNDNWYTVSPEFNDGKKIFVNCGDYMSLLSNGEYISPLHRVIPPTAADKERISFVLFFYPNYNAKIPNYESDSDDKKQKHDYSLLTDQSKNEDSSFDFSQSFGAYIKHKWAQVQRIE